MVAATQNRFTMTELSILPPIVAVFSFHRSPLPPQLLSSASTCGKRHVELPNTSRLAAFPTRMLCSLNAGPDLGNASEVERSDGGNQESQLVASDDFGIEILVGSPFSRRAALKRVEEELAKGNDEKALAIVLMLQGRPGGLRGFGAAAQVPQQLYSLQDLRLNKIETSRLLSPVDTTLGGVRRNLQLAAVFGGIVAWQTLGFNQYQLLFILLTLTILSGIDLVLNGGGIEALIIDTLGRVLSQNYKDRVAKHEAGHFLIAYLIGVLPKSYTLSSLDAFMKTGSLNVQAGTTFVDFQFQEEVKSGRLSSGTLNKYSCIALAGVATEYLLFGLAEGGVADIQQLDNLLKSLSFTQKKADSQVRWAVLNTITLLRRHTNAHAKLATAMISGKPISECIEVIEGELEGVPDI